MSSSEIRVPDIGGATDVDVIEILVQPGDVVSADDSIVTLEGDKASMEVPAPCAGTVESIQIKVGDKVSEGSLLMTFSAGEVVTSSDAGQSVTEKTGEVGAAGNHKEIPLYVPDIGGAEKVDVIEIHIKSGDKIEVDSPLVTLEGDKASMEVPAECAGTIVAVQLAVGDKVSAGDQIGLISVEGSEVSSEPQASANQSQPSQSNETAPNSDSAAKPSRGVHAGPAVRRLAKEFAVNLSQVPATGAKGRITKDDLKRFMQGSSEAKGGSLGLSISATPQVDFSQFGQIDVQPLSKINKLSGANLHRNWVSIPHVTQFAESDITEMESFRQAEKDRAKQQGVRLTPIAFIMKAVVAALKAFPRFNSSLSADGTELVLKQYYHVGVAVDTPQGLVVPVIRDVDQKGIYDLARELASISEKARTKGLGMKDMQGGCFTISSLGGIGGTAFTPIINAPEVAILGVSKSERKPVYDAKGELVPRLMLPLSLSYDHRVIDGAEGARFVVYLSRCLADIRTLLL